MRTISAFLLSLLLAFPSFAQTACDSLIVESPLAGDECIAVKTSAGKARRTTPDAIAALGGGGGAWGTITGTLSDQTDLQNALDLKLNISDFTSTADTWLGTKDTDDLLEGLTNLYFTNERTDDRAAALIQNGTGITWSYNDGLGTLTPTVTITQYTDELAQDAVGAMATDGSLVYVDATPLLTRGALTGDISAPQGSNTTTLATVNSNVGQFGSSSAVSRPTVNAKGLITAIDTVAIAFPATFVVTDESADTTSFPLFATDATGTLGLKTNSAFTFNASTGALGATTLGGTLSTAAQPNVTSLGTLTALQVDNLNLDGNTLSSTSGAINITPVSGSAVVIDTNVSVDGGAVDITGDLDVDNMNINGNTISSTDSNGNIILRPNGNGDVQAGASASNYWQIDEGGILTPVGTAGYRIPSNTQAFAASAGPSAGLWFSTSANRFRFTDTAGTEIWTQYLLSANHALFGFSAPSTSPAQITADQNNYNGCAQAGICRIDTDAARNITGYTAATGSRGKYLKIYYVGTNSAVLQNENASSTAANRFANTSGADITLTAGEGADCWYDDVSTRWRCTELN